MAPNVFVESFDPPKADTGSIINKFPWVLAIVLFFTAAIFCGFRLRLSLFFTFFIDVSDSLKTRVSMKMRGIANQLIFFFNDAIRLSEYKPEIGGETFQIATSKETSVIELVELLIPILADFGYQNVNLEYKVPRVGDVQRNFSDTSKARKRLNWEAKVELSGGLKQIVKWYVEQKKEL